MAGTPQKFNEPLKVKVNPRKWTTGVNVAMVVAVIVILLVGIGYTIYATVNSREVRQDVAEDLAPADPNIE
jgi:hypothetical protein